MCVDCQETGSSCHKTSTPTILQLCPHCPMTAHYGPCPKGSTASPDNVIQWGQVFSAQTCGKHFSLHLAAELERCRNADRTAQRLEKQFPFKILLSSVDLVEENTFFFLLKKYPMNCKQGKSLNYQFQGDFLTCCVSLLCQGSHFVSAFSGVEKSCLEWEVTLQISEIKPYIQHS